MSLVSQEEKHDIDNGSRDDPPRESAIIVGPAEVSAPPGTTRIELPEIAAVPVTEVAEVPEVTIPPVPSTFIAGPGEFLALRVILITWPKCMHASWSKSRSHERLVRDLGAWTPQSVRSSVQAHTYRRPFDVLRMVRQLLPGYFGRGEL